MTWEKFVCACCQRERPTSACVLVGPRKLKRCVDCATKARVMKRPKGYSHAESEAALRHFLKGERETR